MQRAFINFDGRQVHCRWGGAGAPVVLLHPSPLSSAVVVPVASELAKRYRVYALDTPGYGLSDPPAEKPRSLHDYLPVFAHAFDALGLARICLYGVATGAQFAIEFARAYPGRVALLVLDTAGHIAAPDCEAIVRDYFPTVEPRSDGAHLATYWHMVRELNVFFPWSLTRSANRIPRDLPPATFMQGLLLDYLRAGNRYDWAYRPAFYNERAERAQGVTVPALLTRWEGSIALKITDDLIAAGLPANYRVVPLGATMADRVCGIAAAVGEHYQGPSVPEPPPAAPLPRWHSSLLAAPVGQWHARVRTSGTARPLVALHAAGSSSQQLDLDAIAAQRAGPVIAIDLPGHGESDSTIAASDYSVQSIATAVRELLDAASLTDADLLGTGLGAAVATELHRRMPIQGRQLLARRPRAIDSTRHIAWLRGVAPSLAPRLDGGHLFAAWHMLRDEALWQPGFAHTHAAAKTHEQQIEPQSVHTRLVDLMKCGDRFEAAMTAELEFDSGAAPTC
jgi:pimeloyl-ACP methyl ester carboxylesterase